MNTKFNKQMLNNYETKTIKCNIKYNKTKTITIKV